MFNREYALLWWPEEGAGQSEFRWIPRTDMNIQRAYTLIAGAVVDDGVMVMVIMGTNLVLTFKILVRVHLILKQAVCSFFLAINVYEHFYVYAYKLGNIDILCGSMC